MKWLAEHHPSPAMAVAVLALAVASTGTAIAAGQMNGDAIIKKGSLSGNRLRNRSVTGTQIKLSKLGKVPTAHEADTAANAQTANTATTAGSAGNALTANTASSAITASTATTATTASNATALGGIAAAGYTTGTGTQGGHSGNVGTNTTQNGFLDIPGIGQLEIACSTTNVPTVTVRRDVTDEYVLWSNIPDSADAPVHLISSELTSVQPTLTQSFAAHGGQAIIQIAQGLDTPSPSPRTTSFITVSVLPNGDVLATGCLAIAHFTVSGPVVQ
jgi:hypothetical protein